MKGLRWARRAPAAAALLAIAAGLAGCKGFWDPLPNNGGGGGTGTASGVFGFVKPQSILFEILPIDFAGTHSDFPDA